jgi:hypothetical protein
MERSGHIKIRLLGNIRPNLPTPQLPTYNKQRSRKLSTRPPLLRKRSAIELPWPPHPTTPTLAEKSQTNCRVSSVATEIRLHKARFHTTANIDHITIFIPRRAIIMPWAVPLFKLLAALHSSSSAVALVQSVCMQCMQVYVWKNESASNPSQWQACAHVCSMCAQHTVRPSKLHTVPTRLRCPWSDCHITSDHVMQLGVAAVSCTSQCCAVHFND